jgi:hypothetical protein
VPLQLAGDLHHASAVGRLVPGQAQALDDRPRLGDVLGPQGAACPAASKPAGDLLVGECGGVKLGPLRGPSAQHPAHLFSSRLAQHQRQHHAGVEDDAAHSGRERRSIATASGPTGAFGLSNGAVAVSAHNPSRRAPLASAEPSIPGRGRKAERASSRILTLLRCERSRSIHGAAARLPVAISAALRGASK